MSSQFMFAAPVALPAQSEIGQIYPSLNLADAFAIRLPPDAITDPEAVARFIFAHQPAWIGRLTRLRDVIVAGFGLKTTSALAALSQREGNKRVGFFKVYGVSPTEILLGEEDSHLDFRISVLVDRGPDSRPRVTVSTVVHCHNLLGRTYILVIAPIHRLVVTASLRRAARVGWPRQDHSRGQV